MTRRNSKDPKIVEMFKAGVGGKFAAFCVFDSDVDTFGKSLRQGLLSTAEEILGRQTEKIQVLVSKEVLGVCNQRGQLKQRKYTRLKQD